ncbi:hypothetical protein [Paraburkholderia panacisoli]|uniref:hypothetical protein n=1 Tax=Paraburkholderia panacisoli TaxID=2603818 RepID=UPI00165F5602|nr:hypothetical protein [Paraburkholderia panacisoli]
MIQTILASPGGPTAARGAQRQQAFMLRKAVGFAIVASGVAVLVTQALQHALGG